MNELQAVEPMAIQDVKTNIQAIQEVLNTVMIKDVHYGQIVGCGSKPVLLKPGAEKILSTFQIGTEIRVEDLSDGYEFRYRIILRGFHIPTGNTIGYGVGECSTSEKKFAWRVAVCDEEYEATPENRRQIAWKKGYNSAPATSQKQVRQNPSDIANTVLKMGKKRAMIDLCLTVTACSDIFEQDLDENHIREAVGKEPAQHYQQPQSTSLPVQDQPPENLGPKPISAKQVGRLWAIAKSNNKSNEDVHNYIAQSYGYNSVNSIQWEHYETICNWIEGK